MKGEASRTAVLVCQARAAANGRLAPGRFSDPFAVRLLREDERVPVERVRSGQRPKDWREQIRDGFVRGSSVVLATRTVAIDDAIRDARHPQLVVLGAGLDARAYRLDILANTTVYEVDHPLTQQDKRSRAESLITIAKNHIYVPVDFRQDSLTDALADAAYDPRIPTTWVWEGVLPYLTHEAVRSTLAVVADGSATGSRLIATYSTSNALASIAGRVLRALARIFGAHDPLQDEPHISAWSVAEMRTLLEGSGFRITADDDLSDFARQIGVATRRIAPHLGRMVVADR